MVVLLEIRDTGKFYNSQKLENLFRCFFSTVLPLETSSKSQTNSEKVSYGNSQMALKFLNIWLIL